MNLTTIANEFSSFGWAFGRKWSKYFVWERTLIMSKKAWKILVNKFANKSLFIESFLGNWLSLSSSGLCGLFSLWLASFLCAFLWGLRLGSSLLSWWSLGGFSFFIFCGSGSLGRWSWGGSWGINLGGISNWFWLGLGGFWLGSFLSNLWLAGWLSSWFTSFLWLNKIKCTASLFAFLAILYFIIDQITFGSIYNQLFFNTKFDWLN